MPTPLIQSVYGEAFTAHPMFVKAAILTGFKPTLALALSYQAFQIWG